MAKYRKQTFQIIEKSASCIVSAIISLLFAAQWRQHIGLSAFWAFNAALPTYAMGREHIIEKAHLKVFTAFRALKMMA
jgi:hypothetical protein